MRFRKYLGHLGILGIVAWLIVVGSVVLFTRDWPEEWTEMLIYSFILPILFASFFHGRVGGLLVSLVASLISGSLVVGDPEILHSPAIQRVMFQIVFFNAVALVTSGLVEREREAQLRYRSLFERVPVGLYRTKPTGQIVEANPALVQMLGYSSSEPLLEDNLAHLYVGIETRERWQALLEKEGGPRSFEARLRRRDGAIIWVRNSGQAAQDSEGRTFYYEGMMEDISERVRAEEKLSAIHLLGREMILTRGVHRIADAAVEAAYYVLEFGLCSLWLLDQNVLTCQALATDALVEEIEPISLDGGPGIMAAVARSGETIYQPDVTTDPMYLSSGFVARSEFCVPLKVGEQMIGVLNAERALPDAFTESDRRLFQTLADVAAVALENARLHQAMSNQAAWLEEQVAERTTELQERVAEVEQFNRTMAGLLEDLQAANRLSQETARRLEEANAELESFAYSISHDLRAPLRAMDGFSRILLTDYAPQLAPTVTRYLQMIQENAQRMGQLIDDLLTFSRLSRQALKKQPIALADLVRQVLQELQREQEGRRVEISIGDLPLCQGDPALLKQVVVNLLSNALKFTRGRDLAQIEVSWQQDPDGRPVYWVKDNGVGFDMRYASKLFGVFQRLHSDQDGYGGTGVGLAIVQRIIHRHDGLVWAEAEVDEGATFYFTLGGAGDDD